MNSKATPEHTSIKNYNSKIYIHRYVHSNTIYNRQDMKAT